MIQWLRALTVLAEDSGLVPKTPTSGGSQLLLTPVPEDLMLSLGLREHLYGVSTDKQAHICTHRDEIIEN